MATFGRIADTGPPGIRPCTCIWLKLKCIWKLKSLMIFLLFDWWIGTEVLKVCIAFVCVKQTTLTLHNNPNGLTLQQLFLEDLRSCIKLCSQQPQEHSLTSDMKGLHHPVPLQNIYKFVLRFTGGSMVTCQARRRRSWYLKRERMGVSWFESPRANLETMFCLSAQMTGSPMLWFAVRYKSLLNMCCMVSALRGNNID